MINTPSNALPVIGLMLGDVTGIGPEISARLLASGAMKAVARLVVIGDTRVLELGMRDAGVTVPYTVCHDFGEVKWPRDDVPLLDLGNIDPQQFKRGEASPSRDGSPAKR